MRALVFTRPGVVENMTIPAPEPREKEVVLNVLSAAICGSEIHGIDSPGFRRPPLVMGHEIVGRTADGRRVAVNPLSSCGTCAICVGGEPQLCLERSLLGVHRSGGFAEQVAVREEQLHYLPDDMPTEVAVLVEPIANGLQAHRASGAQPGSRLGVIGAGPIGLSCALAAADAGIDVTVVDRSASRAAAAAASGFRISPELENGLDAVIDAVGSSVTHTLSLDAVRPGGTAVWIGLGSPDPAFDALTLVRQGKRVVGTFAYTPDTFASAIDLANRTRPAWTSSYPLDDGATVFMRLVGGDTSVVKAALVP